LAIVTGYDDLGRVETVTSYNSPTARLTENVVNQVAYVYDGWRHVSIEYQARGGAVDPQTTPSVQYA